MSYLIISFLVAANIVSVVLLVLFKDTYAVGSGTNTNLGITKSHSTVSDSHGNVMLTGTATNTLPLYVAPVLSDEELISVGKIHVRVPNSEFALNVVSFFTIVRLDKVNSTVLIFHALGGEQIRIVNGVTTIRLSPTGIDFPICSESVSCAAFEVDNPMLAEKYMAKAEAVLAPFAYAKMSHEAACEACGQAGLLQRWVGAAYEGSLNCQQAFEANADEIRKDTDSSCLKDLMQAGLPAPKGFTDASSITCADLNDQMVHAQASAWETLDCAGDTESLGALDRPCTSAAARTFFHREGRVCIQPPGLGLLWLTFACRSGVWWRQTAASSIQALFPLLPRRRHLLRDLPGHLRRRHVPGRRCRSPPANRGDGRGIRCRQGIRQGIRRRVRRSSRCSRLFAVRARPWPCGQMR